MWSDVLTKPKQGKGFRVDRSWLMNCDENYDDDQERLRTHPRLLPKPAGPVDPQLVTKTIEPLVPDKGVNRRSVLGIEQTGTAQKHHQVTWNMSQERADRGNQKARKLHLELVKMRVLRAKMAKKRIGRE